MIFAKAEKRVNTVPWSSEETCRGGENGAKPNSFPNKAADEKMSCKLESATTKSNGDKCIAKDTISIIETDEPPKLKPAKFKSVADKANKVNVNNNKGDGGISIRSAQLMKPNSRYG